MSWFSELDTREKVLVIGGGALVGIFFIRGIKGKNSTSTGTVSATDQTQQAQQSSDLASQVAQQQAASQGSLMDALAQINTNMTQAISDSNQQIAGALSQNQQAQTQALSSITSLLGQMKTTQAVQQAQPYSIPAPTVAPATMVAQTGGGIISSPFVTHSFEVSKGDSWSQNGNTVTVKEPNGGVGTYNTDTHNSTWDFRNDNIPKLSASQVAQVKANAIAGKPLF